MPRLVCSTFTSVVGIGTFQPSTRRREVVRLRSRLRQRHAQVLLADRDIVYDDRGELEGENRKLYSPSSLISMAKRPAHGS